MTFKYELPSQFRETVGRFDEFANGGTQVTILTCDGKIFEKVLISNSTAIVAIRGFTDLPFRPDEISELHQTEEDRNPSKRGDWHLWDKWTL